MLKVKKFNIKMFDKGVQHKNELKTAVFKACLKSQSDLMSRLSRLFHSAIP